jgi:glycosyltransferase involved in cell wall biosynthesis
MIIPINSRTRILTFLDYYIPSFKSGGPLRTISNIVAEMGDDFDYWIVTHDRDATDTEPYPTVKVNKWNKVEKANVYYGSPRILSFNLIRSLCESIKPDIVYLNSFFSRQTIQYLILRRLRLIPSVPVILAPCGEFSPGALGLKRIKKKIYITLAKKLSLYQSVLLQASAEEEKNEIKTVFDTIETHIAPDVPAPISTDVMHTRIKVPGKVDFIFLSRISPKKNLHTIVEMLRNLSGNLNFSIVGPIRDIKYWRLCQNTIMKLPKHIKVSITGSELHEKVHTLLTKHHFFILPTLGENFGHAILEAMATGTPVIISDQTPWQDLGDKSAGWDIALDDKNKWHNVLQNCVDITQEEYNRLSRGAYDFAIQWQTHNDILKAN